MHQAPNHFVVSNRQNLVPVNRQFLRDFVQQLRSLLRLGGRRFDITLVDDAEIQRLNKEFRGIPSPTDVLSFPWNNYEGGCPDSRLRKEWSGFLGDIVISVETARRDSVQSGISLPMELRQLVLHGALHLLGYDHETDQGEMARLEAQLRRKLKISG
jgi:probable rRNA maturation factor